MDEGGREGGTDDSFGGLRSRDGKSQENVLERGKVVDLLVCIEKEDLLIRGENEEVDIKDWC